MRSKTRSKYSLNPLLVLVAAATLSPPAPAAATPCLTRLEARQHWPDAHLWWHSDARCWDNRRRGAEHYEPRPAVKLPPLKVPDNWAGAPEPGKTIAPSGAIEIYYPELIRSEPDWRPRLIWQQPMLTPASIVYWPELIDIDRVPFLAWDKRVGQ